MPSIKQGGGITLTFSKKNEDVKEILEREKASGMVITNYICDAIRFYEDNKNDFKASDIKDKDIERMIEIKIKSILEDMNFTPDKVAIVEQNECTQEESIHDLEDDEFTDDMDLDED